jgi:hypothetical protein
MKKLLSILSLFLIFLLANILLTQEDIITAARQNDIETVKKMLQENKNPFFIMQSMGPLVMLSSG